MQASFCAMTRKENSSLVKLLTASHRVKVSGELDTAVEFFIQVRAKADSAGDIFKSLTKVIQAIALKVSGKMCIYYIGVNCTNMRVNSVTLPVEVNEIPKVKSVCANMWSTDAFWYLVNHEILSKFSGVRVYILLQLYFCTICLHPLII